MEKMDLPGTNADSEGIDKTGHLRSLVGSFGQLKESLDTEEI